MNRDAKQLNRQDMTSEQELDAGDFSAWLQGMQNTLLFRNQGVDVPCGDCNACCRSSYFIHIRPEENRTLSHINKKLLFAAPGLPKGHVLMGYNKDGECPMLTQGRCSIYEHRPHTCRCYDCRLFAATGVVVGDETKSDITQQAMRWRFSYPTKQDQDLHEAVKSAARFLQEHTDCFDAGFVPKNESQLAIMAIKVHSVFLTDGGETSRDMRTLTESELAKAIMDANEKFEAGRL